MAITQGWKNTIDLAKTDSSWDDYDTTIQAEVADYRTRLSLSAPDWKIFKAQVWTETGAASSQWGTRPMQIGNAGDPALDVLRKHREHSNLIMSSAIMAKLKSNQPTDVGTFNVQLGMAYAYTKLSTFDSVVTDTTQLSYTIVAGDSLEKIAAKVGTTKQNLLDLNPKAANMIMPKQVLAYQKAQISPTSISITAQRLQLKYNGGGDSDYADKLTYCLSVIATIKR